MRTIRKFLVAGNYGMILLMLPEFRGCILASDQTDQIERIHDGKKEVALVLREIPLAHLHISKQKQSMDGSRFMNI